MNDKTRVAMITGAGQGIGRGIAQRFAAAGHRLLIAEINSETGRAVADELAASNAEAVFVHTDVTDTESIEATIRQAEERWGGVDILINNAYTADPPARIEDKQLADYELSFSGSFFGPAFAMNRVFAGMKERGWGRIINICTLNGVNAHMFTSTYNTAKEALRCLTRSAAREWADTGITVNAICPAAVTPSFEEFKRNSPKAAAESVAANPMGRLGDPAQDIGGVALFLAGDDAGYLTGNTLFVDGGAHINGVPWKPQLQD